MKILRDLEKNQQKLEEREKLKKTRHLHPPHLPPKKIVKALGRRELRQPIQRKQNNQPKQTSQNNKNEQKEGEQAKEE